MTRIGFTIPGPPQGKARPKVTRNQYTGDSVSYTPDKTVQYEELTRIRWRVAAGTTKFAADSALRITIVAGYPIPKSKSKKQKAAMLVGVLRPTKKPDCDNIVKIICDALNGFAYKDDAQVVEILFRKKYMDGAGETSVKIQEV